MFKVYPELSPYFCRVNMITNIPTHTPTTFYRRKKLRLRRMQSIKLGLNQVSRPHFYHCPHSVLRLLGVRSISDSDKK